MTYLTGDIPVGAYDPARLTNLGIGHAAIDSGGGYTYFNPATGHEFSAVAGFTYNFKNRDTQYQNGIDFHVDWGDVAVPLQAGFRRPRRIRLSADHRRLWSTSPCSADSARASSASVRRSGFLFPVGDMQGYLNLKGYGEFEAQNRPSGWNTWLTFSISPMAPTSTVTPTRRVVTK